MYAQYVTLLLITCFLTAYTQAFCVGVIVVSGVILSVIDNLDDDPISESPDDDADRFRAVTWRLLSVAIAGILTQGVMAIIRRLYYAETFKARFIVFATLVSFDTYVRSYIKWDIFTNGNVFQT